MPMKVYSEEFKADAVALYLSDPRILSGWMHRSSSSPVPLAFALALGSAWVTSSLGLQPVFGGFIAGLAMRIGSRQADADVIRSLDQTAGLLLPLFFIVTGLSLNIGTIGRDGLILLAIITVAAGAGKIGPSYAISRMCGIEPAESATIAVLLNTRGLTELIALSVGLADGIIGRRLFSVLVLMALVTTMMTGPALSIVRARPPTRGAWRLQRLKRWGLLSTALPAGLRSARLRQLRCWRS